VEQVLELIADGQQWIYGLTGLVLLFYLGRALIARRAQRRALFKVEREQARTRFSSNVLAGYYARDQFAPGDSLVVDGEVGTLEAIGTVSARIAISEEILIVPNIRLTEGRIRVRRESQPETTRT
jgi:hypothetical protein